VGPSGTAISRSDRRVPIFSEPEPSGSSGLLSTTWRRFDPSSSPSATEFKLAVPRAARTAKIPQICRSFSPGELAGLPQLLSIEAGECIFLRNLRTRPRSPVLDFVEIRVDSGEPVLNPSPSTNSTF
jgi:hypothetical protein